MVRFNRSWIVQSFPNGGNTFEQTATIRVPKGITHYEGIAASQTGGRGRTIVPGGGSQIFILNVPAKWLQSVQEALVYLKPGLGVGIDWCGLIRERPFDSQYHLANIEQSADRISLSFSENLLICFPRDADMTVEKISGIIVNITVRPVCFFQFEGNNIPVSPDQKIQIQLVL